MQGNSHSVPAMSLDEALKQCSSRLHYRPPSVFEAGSGGSGSSTEVDVAALHCRASVYLRYVESSLDQCSASLKILEQFTRASSSESQEGEHQNATSQTAVDAKRTMDRANAPATSSTVSYQGAYTVLKPPPTVTESEVNDYVAALRAAEKKALADEWELTALDGFDYLSGTGESESDDNVADDYGHDGEAETDHYVSSTVRKAAVAAHAEVATPPVVVIEQFPGSEVDDNSTRAGVPTKTSASGSARPGFTVEYTDTTWLNVPSTGRLAETEEDPSSFSAFSRKMLAKHDGSGDDPLALGGGRVHPVVVPPPHPAAAAVEPQITTFPLRHPVKSSDGGTCVGKTRTANRKKDAKRHSATAPSATQETKKQHKTAAELERLEVLRNEFIRSRVRDVILSNKIMEKSGAKLSAAASRDADSRMSNVAASVAPALKKMRVLLQESEVLLQAVAQLENRSLGERAGDPSQFLCVPRLRKQCNLCATAFSSTVTKVMCGRCGQFLCPKCCTERGVGPDVNVEGGEPPVSLGWEPLCTLCFNTCSESQRSVLQDRKRRLLCAPPDTASSSSQAAATAAGRGAASLGIESMSVKQAVLLGAHCVYMRLPDGLAPFYVYMKEDDTAARLDVLRYHITCASGSLRRRWQDAGTLMSGALSGAGSIVHRQNLKRRQERGRDTTSPRSDTTTE